MNSSRPFVLMNMAMTADGKIATANRQVVHFGSRRDQRHLYELRATADAVMCGARTAEAPGVTLGPGPARYQRERVARGLRECHLRVIVSGSGTVNVEAAVFRSRVSPLVVLTTARAGARRLARLRQAADVVRVCGRSSLDFSAALAWWREGENSTRSYGGRGWWTSCI
jgi:riboflavin biosynthesis pyrimidine reductase